MFPNGRNVMVSGGNFTVVNEQTGMTGALYESVINR